MRQLVLPVRSISIFSLLLLGTLGCTTWIRPQPPSVASKIATRPEPKDSILRLPIVVTGLEDQIRDALRRDKFLPDCIRMWGAWTCEGDVCWKFQCGREDLAVTWDSNTDQIKIGAMIPYDFGLRWWKLSGDCLGGGAQMGIEVAATLGWTKDWHLVRSVKARVAPHPHHPCGFTLLDVDGSNALAGVFEKLLNQQIKERVIPLIRSKEAQAKKRAEVLWLAGYSPQSLGEDLWLVTTPVSVGMMPIQRDHAGRFMTGMLLKVRPELIAGAKLAARPATPLPELTEVPPGRVFSIDVDATMEWATAGRIAEESLKHKTLEFSAVGKAYHIVVRSIRFDSAGNQVLAKVEFDGDAKGHVFLTGTPQYDNNTKQLSVPDLDYTAETQLSLRVLNWWKHDDFRRQLRKAALWSMTERFEHARKIATAAMNGSFGAVRLTGTVDRITPSAPFADSRGIHLILGFEGAVEADISIPEQTARQ